MSSYWAGYSGTGLVLSGSEFNAMLEVYKEKNPEQADIEDSFEDSSVGETPFIKSLCAGHSISDLMAEENVDKVTYLNELNDDDVSGVTFWPFYKPNGQMNVNVKKDGKWEEAIYEHPVWQSKDGVCYVCWSDKNMCGPRAFEEKPYASYDAFVQEFKDKLGAYLPEDFDWNAHLGYVSYACYA